MWRGYTLGERQTSHVNRANVGSFIERRGVGEGKGERERDRMKDTGGQAKTCLSLQRKSGREWGWEELVS